MSAGNGTTTFANAAYTYDAMGRIATVGNSADTLTYGYVPGTNMIGSATWQEASINTVNTYDQYKRLTNIAVNNTSAYGYTLNGKNQRTGATLPDGRTWSYSYDTLGQLTGAVKRDSANTQLAGLSYLYDQIGNRTSATENNTTTTYTSNLVNQYTQIASQVPTYDADGNMTSYNGWTYTWNGENRLVAAENSDTRLEFSYDYMGRRLEKKVYSKGLLTLYDWSLEKHRKFVYDGYKLIAEFEVEDDNATLFASYLWQPTGLDVPLMRIADNTETYYIADGNKNIIALKDSSGADVSTYAYTPFGALENPVDGDENPFRFSSEYADDETGLVYYNYRYYSPQLGRWTKRDPSEEEGGVNLYNMCNNSTITNMDLLGFFLLVSDLENPTYFYNLTSSYSPDEEKMRRERLLNQLRNLFLDEEGFQIFSRWVRGEGAWLDAPFGNYLMKSPTIKNEVQDVLEDELEKNKNIRNNSYFNIRKSIDIVFPDNGYKTGYQLLHGTNRTVGGFKIAGKILKRTRNCFSGEMRYSWNDIIDPNPKYIKDIILYIGAQILFSGSPRDYVIRIPFNAKFDAIHSSMAGGKVTYWLFYGFPGATSLND